MSELVVHGIAVQVVRKRVKNLNLSVRGPDGAVRVSVPLQTSDVEVRRLVSDRLRWIERHRERLRARAPAAEPDYVSGETLSVWGKAVRLEVEIGRSAVRWGADVVRLKAAPGSDRARREAIVNGWYRGLLAERIPLLVMAWAPRLGVPLPEWRIRRMRTRWGSCNIPARRIWLNLELAKFPPECLEYVVVHELVHLLERYHNARFYALMDAALPDWPLRRARLNDAPIDG